MAHTSEQHEFRKNEIVDAGKMLFFQKGYDRTSIQDIIDHLGIAKGTFYHYFKSKEELLDALVDKIITEMSERFKPLVAARKSAVEKINDLFRLGAAFKVENLDAFVVLVKTMYRDENQILRDRMFQRSIEKNSPTITGIVQQGIEDGMFTTSYPAYMGEVMINLGRSINETICTLLLTGKTDAKTMSAVMTERMEMYQEMIERILGAPRGSVKLYESNDLERIVDHFLKVLKSQEDTDETTRRRYKMW